MKFFRYAFLTLLLLIFSFILPTAEAIELLNINENMVKSMQTEFKNSLKPERKKLLKSHWNCQLYGMRSRIQSTQKDNFYAFHLNKDSLQNSGSQIIKTYTSTPTGWQGQQGPLFEEIRATPDGRLVGEMSIKQTPQDRRIQAESAKVLSLARSGHEVIAYSVCN